MLAKLSLALSTSLWGQLTLMPLSSYPAGWEHLAVELETCELNAGKAKNAKLDSATLFVRRATKVLLICAGKDVPKKKVGGTMACSARSQGGKTSALMT